MNPFIFTPNHTKTHKNYQTILATVAYRQAISSIGRSHSFGITDVLRLRWTASPCDGPVNFYTIYAANHTHDTQYLPGWLMYVNSFQHFCPARIVWARISDNFSACSIYMQIASSIIADNVVRQNPTSLYTICYIYIYFYVTCKKMFVICGCCRWWSRCASLLSHIYIKSRKIAAIRLQFNGIGRVWRFLTRWYTEI